MHAAKSRNALFMIAALMLAAIACGSSTATQTPAQQQAPAILFPTQGPPTAVPPASQDEGSPRDSITYLEHVGALLFQSADTFDDFAILWGLMADDPLLILDPVWNDAYTNTESEMHRIIRRFRGLDAPPEFREVNNELLAFCDDMDDALALQRRGIDQMDIAALEAADAAIQRATSHLDMATLLLADIADTL